jgi:hypothetical protein
MGLSFDPSAVLAPGGIASGLDNLGAAVVRAMNSRAERRYALEAENRQRGYAQADMASRGEASAADAIQRHQFAKELAKADQDAAMARVQEQNKGSLARTGVQNLGETARAGLSAGQRFATGLLNNATDLGQSFVKAAGRPAAGSSANSAEALALRRATAVENAVKARLASDPDVMAYKEQLANPLVSMTPGGKIEIERLRKVVDEKAKAARTDVESRFGGGATKPLDAPAPPPAASAVVDPEKEAAWARASKNGWTREAFEAKWATRGK